MTPKSGADGFEFTLGFLGGLLFDKIVVATNILLAHPKL
jgi:hypothetical protein